MKKNRTKMVFESIGHRDGQLRVLKSIGYTIDKNNPLVVWLNI